MGGAGSFGATAATDGQSSGHSEEAMGQVGCCQCGSITWSDTQSQIVAMRSTTTLDELADIMSLNSRRAALTRANAPGLQTQVWGRTGTFNTGTSWGTGIAEDGSVTPNTKARAAYLLKNMGVGVGKMRKQREGLVEARRLTDQYLQGARSGNLRQLVTAIEEGADVNSNTLRGQNALMLAAASHTKGSMECMRFLIDARMSIDIADFNGWTPLLFACRNSNKEAVGFLLRNRAAINQATRNGETPPMLAALDKNDSLVIDLIGKQAELDARDYRGWPLLFYAVDLGCENLVKWLLKSKASVKERGHDRTTALTIAAVGGRLSISMLLAKHGCGLNMKNMEGNTALILSIKQRHTDVANWLLDITANVSIKNQDDESALSVATKEDFLNLATRIETILRKGS